jgi:hypothetical protein
MWITFPLSRALIQLSPMLFDQISRLAVTEPSVSADLAGDARGDVLAGPLVERQLYRLVGSTELGRIGIPADLAKGQAGRDDRPATHCFP